VHSLEIIPVDNPLANPFDPLMASAHKNSGYDCIIRACHRKNAEESVGIIAVEKERLIILEYSELEESQKKRIGNGKLAYPYANTGLLSFSVAFIQKNGERRAPSS